MIKILNLKLVILLEYQNKKKVSAKGYVPNWYKAVFVIAKVKSTVPRTYVISDLNGEKNVGVFFKKELQKTNQKNLELIK